MNAAGPQIRIGGHDRVAHLDRPAVDVISGADQPVAASSGAALDPIHGSIRQYGAVCCVDRQDWTVGWA